MVRGSDGQTKDTLRNVRQAGKFVANIVSDRLSRAMNISSAEFPPEINEFEAAGLAAVSSVKIRPARVAESTV